MSDVDSWVKLIGAVTAAVGVLAGIAKWLLKLFPPRATGLAAEVARLSHDLSECRTDMRKLTDYVHDLREEIARDGGTPPDWPEGLRL